MAKSVKYKQPRRFNAITVVLILVAMVIAYLTYQYLPLFLVKQEAYRVLDETASVFAGQKNRYLDVPEERDNLERKMRGQLQQVGIEDPGFETWIEIDSKHKVRIGVAYIQTVHWPFDVVEPQEDVIELEYPLTLEW